MGTFWLGNRHFPQAPEIFHDLNFSKTARMLMPHMRIKVRPGRPKSKPWYSRECYLAKKSAKASLTTFKETNTDVDRNIYVSNRKRYTTLINFNKKKYLQEKQELLKNARDSANFWKTIATLKDKSYIQGNITILEWQCFYNKLLSAETTIGSDLSTLSRIDPELYCEISITEITREISSLANEKACGADEIPNEALKTLPFEHLVTLKNIFNRIINSGSYPLIWSKSIIHPIFKSGDRDNPSNYRGIALISNLSKLFTSILKSRLRNWIEGRSIIPENQAGFRKGYSCQDHIFTLLSLIQLTLRRKRRKLYAFFVDLKKAFDTVPHSLLWSKLGELGLDFRFVNLIRNYFEQMTTTNLDNNQVSTDQNLDSLVNTFSKQILNAMLAADMRIKVRPGRPKSKPWYSRECYLAKKSAKASLTTFKETNTDVDRNIYVSNRKRYTTLINFNKKKYLQEKQELLKNARDSANFWKTIATLKDKSYIQGNITILEWQCFYNKLLSAETTIGSDLSTLSRIDPELYCEISITEITREISSLANEKACGADEIPNEALKTLPFEHLVTLKNIFNRIINSGSYPLIWSKSIIHPIFKSGDRDNPSNYRGIALISNLSKLFTSILKSRLRNWIEGRSIIPENQAGFRKGYSCQDHIFTLLSLIQLTLRRKRRKLYAFFVDLKKAFDTVPHSLLWSKLGELGLDFRFVNLIRNYFEQMTTTAYTSLILERSTS
ncbi:hypothetical protein LAZ67_X001352 [Cordylochernes scorpioides]|uniref:Reverse transcriptase domain-containing protein n=1 Tax=Cordylochernes scorpioides TaxID=51811 RepID=A0ABY6LWL3_9ARAC|nr:hypothetical protein LAZ67_X001352 [Cordylochernes scorpioides]